MPERAILYIMRRMEAKLQDLMSEEEYMDFNKEIAMEAFRMEIEDMADSEFKDFVLEHFDEITGEDEI